jgi:hypothetical protein
MMRIVLFVLLSACSLASFGQAGNYRSLTSGPWGTPGTWERDADLNGTFEQSPSLVAPNTPSTAGTITIRNTHVVNVGASVSIDQTTIQSGGTLTVDPTFNLTLNNGSLDEITVNAGGVFTVNGTLIFGGVPNRTVQVSGDFNNNGTISGASVLKFFFLSGSNYYHQFADGGTIPAASWNANSSVNIVGYTSGNSTPPSGLTQTFGHFVWNAPGQDVSINLGGLPAVTNGDFSIVNTGSDALYYSINGAGTTLDVGGNLNGVGGVFVTTTGDSAPSTIDVTGNINVTDGYIQFADDQDITINLTGDFLLSSTGQVDFSASGATTTLNIEGNFTQTGGSLFAQVGIFNMNFNGSSVQTYTSNVSPVGLINYTVSSSSTLSIPSTNYIGGNAATSTFVMNGILQVGSTAANGAIQTGTGATAGNVRISGTRTYANGSTIVYNGSGAQVIGNGHPTSTGVNTTINNSSGVSLNADRQITGTLTLQAGNLSVGAAHKLTTESSIVPNSNFIVVTSTSDITVNGASLTGTYPFQAGSQTIRNFTLNRSSGSVTFANPITITGTVTLTNGSVIFSGQTLALNGTFSATGSGTLSPSSTSTLSIGGTGAFGTPRIDATNNSVATLTYNRSSGTATLISTLIVTGTFNLTDGDFTNGNGLQMGNGSTIIRNSSAQLLSNPPDLAPAATSFNVTYSGATLTTGLELSNTTDNMLGNLTINGGTVTLDKDIIVHGNVTLQSSTFDAAGKNITLASTSGTWNKGSGSFIGGAGTLTIDNTPSHNANYTVVVTNGNAAFSNITIVGGGTNTFTLPSGTANISGNIVNNGTFNGSTGTINFNGSTTISGSSATSLNNIAISGTLIAPSSTALNISGNFTNNATFNHSNGSIVFNGTTIISGSATTNLFNVSITGSLTAPTGNLGIAGNLSSSGTFTHNGGTILFNGTVVAQSITGSTLTFNNMTVSNPISPGVSINNTTRLNGLLTLSSGAFFDADGSGSGVFIVSSSSQTAGGMIGNLATPANFVGSVTVERYIHSVSGGDYRYLAFPITNANVSMLKSSIFVTGSYSDRSTHADNANIDDSGNTNPSVFTYNSTTQAYVGVSGATTAATPLSNTVGYSTYDFNNGAVTASYRGPIGKGSIPVAISSTNGNFNLVPNPYPSTIDWDNVTKTNVNNAMYIRIGNNVFSSYVGGVAANPPFVGWSGEVATGQSFFTTSNGGGATLTFKEADKTTNAFYFLRTKSPENYFRIQLISSKGDQDEAVIHFVKGATDQMDTEFDAPKMKNGYLASPLLGKKNYPNIASYIDSPSAEYSINTIDELTAPKIVRLSVSDVAAGTYSIKFADFESMYLGYSIVLVDTFMKTEMEGKEGATYDFSVTAEKGSFGSDRFYLRINGVGVTTGIVGEVAKYMVVYPNPATDKLVINLSPEEDNNLKAISLIDVTGRTMISSESSKQLLVPGVKTIDVSSYSSGVYLLNIQVGENTKAIRVIKK